MHTSIHQSIANYCSKYFFFFFVKGEQAKYVMEIKPTWSSIVGELLFKTSFIVKMSNKKKPEEKAYPEVA